MSCRFSNYDGLCTLFEEDGENIDCMGFDYDTGACLYEDDPDPSYTCESYDEC
jgi:hypothetical protein